MAKGVVKMVEAGSTNLGGTPSQYVRMQELFLPVHGLVELFPEEIAVIDHPSFQRLR